MTGGIVLAGGRSRRMGRDKASLDWHGAPLLAHVCAVVRRGTGGGPVVVVRSAGQPLPVLPGWVEVTDDAVAGIGPMQGLLDGLRALPAAVERAFLAGTDAPLLRPAYVTAVLDRLDAEPGLDALVPYVRGYRHPLLAGYRTAGAAVRLAQGLPEGRRRAGQVFEGCLRLLSEDELTSDPGLRRQDPGLVSVDDVDTPERWAEALAEPLPEIVVETPTGTEVRPAVRLADLLPPGSWEAGVVLNGTTVEADPLLPLAPGDRVRIG